MLTAQVILYTVLVIVNVAAIIAWIAIAKRRHLRERVSWSDVVIGGVTSFLDTFGIGSYAQITALFKLRGRPSDELIPGTLNVGSAVPAFLGSLLFFAAIAVEPVLLTCMVISSGAGAWIGAGVVSRMPRRTIQLIMGSALLIAAASLAMAAVGVLTPSGTAMGLGGWRFVVAVLANFLLGALMCIGIGNYAPSMALLGLLGMHPIAAYPIMIGSDGVLIPVASLGFLRSGRFSHGAAVGLTFGGLLGTVVAFPLIKTIGEHLALMRWLVIVVILYAAVSMLRSARASAPELDGVGAELHR
jgi:uncharacterized membrane protein YfcA